MDRKKNLTFAKEVFEYLLKNYDNPPEVIEELGQELGVCNAEKVKLEAGIAKNDKRIDDKNEQEADIRGKKYIVYLSTEQGIGHNAPKELSRREIRDEYLEKRNNYDIFIHLSNVYIKGQKSPTHLDERSLRFLILFLKYKEIPLKTIPLYRKVWHGSEDTNQDDDEKTVWRYMKPYISKLRTKLTEFIDFDIYKIRGMPATCKGNFSFCIILDKKTAEFYRFLDAE